MKLVEIKNSLARLHYEPVDFPLILSDFLTIDDGNQKIIAQVVSIESTKIDTKNCAILKFVIDINDNNEFSSYGGYVPAIDALVSKTKKSILETIFSEKISGINIGKISSSSNIEVNLKKTLTENFLYIQADRLNDIQNITNKFIEFNKTEKIKTLYIDFDGLNNYTTNSILTIGKEFKLPINNDTLNYIYENDLNSLTVEQKAIVQDIILDIQEYISTLKDGFIPFKILLNVVNEIYTTDKSIGIILLRNKLLKYAQMNIFADNLDEIGSLKKSILENDITSLCLKNTSVKWQKETLNFIINHIDDEFNLILNINDEIIDSDFINKIYKIKTIKPIVTSKYDSIHAQQLKSFAQNLILFKPITQQKDFATYNSFFNKINQNELIISGESTFYTPLIIKGLNNEIKLINNQIQETFSYAETTQNIINNEKEFKAEELAEAITEEIIDNNNNQLTQADESENSLENEIAKDVDKMFLAESNTAEKSEYTEKQTIAEEISINYDEMFEDVDLDMLDDLNEIENINPILDDKNIEEINEETKNDIINIDEIQELKTEETYVSNHEYDSEYPEENSFISNDINDNAQDNLQIYSTELNENTDENTINIAEGNIVYHEKYGRGIVEQLISYGKKTLCSIQFDNVGRRLLDPNLTDLKQI